MLPHIIETNSLILEKNDGTITHPWHDGLSTSTQFLCVWGGGGEGPELNSLRGSFQHIYT